MKTYRKKIAVFSLRKRPKPEGKMSPKILLKKNKERKIERARRKKRGEGKRTRAALLVFMLTSLEIVFERKKLFEGRALFWL